MSTATPDDALVIAALTRLSIEFDETNTEIADRAWELALERAEQHQTSPTDAVQSLF